MSREYAQQIIRELERTLIKTDNMQIEKLVKEIIKAKRIFVAGQGRSGFMVKSFAMRLMHIGFEAYVVGETITPSIQSGDLLIIGSGSGETGSLVMMAKKAKESDVQLAVITTNANSSIGKISDVVIGICAQAKGDEDNESTVQPMGSLFEQCLLLLLDSVILSLMDLTKKDGNKMFGKHANLE